MAKNQKTLMIDGEEMCIGREDDNAEQNHKAENRTLNDNRPLFSMVVLSFMQRQYLVHCLESIYAQTYPNIELVVCDDWSPDFDADEVRSYINKTKTKNIRKVTVYQQDHAAGIVENARKGIELSTGAFFKLHAMDDMLNEETSLEKIAELMLNPETCVVAARAVACYPDGTETEHYYPNLEDMNRLQGMDAESQFTWLSTMPWNTSICSNSIFWRRKAYEDNGGMDTSYRIIVDLPLLLRLTASGRRITFDNCVTTVYRYGGLFNRGYIGIHRESYKQYLNDIARAYREISLEKIQKTGNRKKIMRCKQQIKQIETSANVRPDWDYYGFGKQLAWKIRNCKYLLIHRVYALPNKKRSLAIRKPLIFMGVFTALYFLKINLLPGVSGEKLWAFLFFATLMWLVINLLCVEGQKMIKGLYTTLHR